MNRDGQFWAHLAEGVGLTEAQVVALDAVHLHKKTHRDAAAVLADHGLKGSYSTVRRWISDADIDEKWRRYDRLAWEEHRRKLCRQAAEMALAGETKEHIAAQLGVSRATVYNYLDTPEGLAALASAGNVEAHTVPIMRARGVARLFEVAEAARSYRNQVVAALDSVEGADPIETLNAVKGVMQIEVTALDRACQHLAGPTPTVQVNNTAIAQAKAEAEVVNTPGLKEDIDGMTQQQVEAMARLLLGGDAGALPDPDVVEVQAT